MKAKTRLLSAIWLLPALGVLLPSTASAAPGGIYAVWYAGHNDLLTSLPYLSGGQIALQWADIEKAPGAYSWNKLDSLLAANAGHSSSLQINGNLKPAYLFDSVPHIANWGDVQVQDTQGVLMYWHPAFTRAYVKFLDAQAQHLNALTAGQKASLLGIRTNYDPIGTEHLDVPAQYQAAALWTAPPGVTNGPDFSASVKTAYMKTVLDAYIASFAAGTVDPIRLFIRNNLPDTIQHMQASGQPAGYTYLDYFRDGKFGWMQTGAEMEPRANGGNGYRLFVDYCRAGLTSGYAEPMADSWGNHAGIVDPRWCPPVQWNYWRLLCDLHVGITFIACYGADLGVAQNGTHGGASVGADYQAEYDSSFRFAATYTGYAADPAHAPGGWIAFRVGGSQYPAGSPWANVTDYTMHAALLNPQDLPGLDARNSGGDAPVVAGKTLAGEKAIGPYNQRFGAWARRLPAGVTAQIRLDTALVRNLNAASASVRVTYLDSMTAAGSFTVRCGQDSLTVALGASGLWKTTEMRVTSIPVAPEGQPHLTVRAAGTDVTLHMVEVVRHSTTGVRQPASRPHSPVAPQVMIDTRDCVMRFRTPQAAGYTVCDTRGRALHIPGDRWGLTGHDAVIALPRAPGVHIMVTSSMQSGQRNRIFIP